MRAELRQMIRELLVEQVGSLTAAEKKSLAQQMAPPGTPAKPLSIKQETISIRNDDDLARLVARVCTLAADPATRDELQNGRYQFRLAHAGSVSTTVGSVDNSKPSSTTARFERGLFTERDCDNLDKSVTLLQVGKTVRLTPLATDNLRRKGITIERGER